MPELAEVEFFRRRWEVAQGEKILHLEIHEKARPLRGVDGTALRRALTGAHLVSSRGHGKQLFFYFSPAAVLGLHMGMTGRLTVEPPDYKAGRHDHLVLRQKKRTLVFNDSRMFGRVRFAAGPEKPDWEASLPPEVLSASFTLPYLTGLLKNRKVPMKAFLLNQLYFPGIGNWMADEILWQARIAPRQTAGSLSPAAVRALHRCLRSISRTALRAIPAGKKSYGELPKGWLFQRRWAKGGDCPRCVAPLRHADVGGRTTCWCAVCQPMLAK